jgi:hypothetical protein
MARERDLLAGFMKVTLARAARGIAPHHHEVQFEEFAARALLRQAARLAAHT